MNSLIIVEGYDPKLPGQEVLDRIASGTAYLLYLSPRVKAEEYKARLESLLGGAVKVETVDYRKWLDYETLRQGLFEFIRSLPGQLKVGGKALDEYLKVGGLDMWWSGGIVEATAYKQNLMQNYYYLSGVRQALTEFSVKSAWASVKNRQLQADLYSMLKEKKVGILSTGEKKAFSCGLKYYSIRLKSWVVFLLSSLAFKILFAFFCPKAMLPSGSHGSPGRMHIFYSLYPFSIRLQEKPPRAKIYEDLPNFLSDKLGGSAYYLTYISPVALFNLKKLVKDSRDMWAAGFRFLPMILYLPFSGIFRIFFSPVRYFKYWRIRSNRDYRRAFEISGINMQSTFGFALKKSLLGDDAWINLIHYTATRNFMRKFSKSVIQAVYHIEFHNWEAAFINAVKDADVSIPLVGIQQSAPNPILLSPFFMEGLFSEGFNYKLPDLILCSGSIYRDLLLKSGIPADRLLVMGHINCHALMNLSLDEAAKRREKARFGLDKAKKICLVALSVNYDISEAIVCMLSKVVGRIPDTLFLMQGHPDTPVSSLVDKYGLSVFDNVKMVAMPITALLPLADSFLSLCTSVSQEALGIGLPQVNLDAIGLPKANPLHIICGLIKDVETPDELLSFLREPEAVPAHREKAGLFLGDADNHPFELYLSAIKGKFGFKGEQTAR